MERGGGRRGTGRFFGNRFETHLISAPLSIGGVADHVHVLVTLSPTIDVATLVKKMKGGSSHLVNQRPALAQQFK